MSNYICVTFTIVVALPVVTIRTVILTVQAVTITTVHVAITVVITQQTSVN